MDIWNQLLQGFITAGTPINLLWALLGCTIGTAVGVLPGIGPATAVAMLLPITLKVDPTASMIFFAGIYYGAMYGGSTTSILLNTPGESGSMVTAMEGNKMAKSGRAGAALATSAIGSFVAGTIATVLVTFCAPVVANYAVRLGPPEYFLLMVLAFCTVSAVLGKSTVAIVPATNEPMAEVASAAPARPLLAILLPSIAVTIEPDSPGVFSRIEVVEPPYIAP